MGKDKGKRGKSKPEAARVEWSDVKEPRKGAASFRRLSPSERDALREEIVKNPEFLGDGEKELGLIEKSGTMLDFFADNFDEPITGKALVGSPKEMFTILDFTGLRGSGSNIYHSLIYQLPKWSYIVKKIDESIQISPVYADLYNLVVGQKQKIEASIKTGLASAAQAVADYELLSHDARRYAEILNYFKEGQNDEHVLRSLFTDRVDAFTGEGYSLITMAKRWPTIITDFIRMGSPDFKGEKWDDVKTIHAKLDVSMAEATVLKTKDRLFKEWKESFFPAVKTRYSRVQALLQARKKSVDEYRNWLKPYVAKYKAMKESDEDNPALWVSDAYTTPGFAQSEGLVGTRLWVWKVFRVWESGKPSYYKDSRQKKWVLYPYDNFVKNMMKRIEYKYNVRITDKDVEKLLADATASGIEKGIETAWMSKDFAYYIFFDIKILLSLLRTPPPEGMESDNLMFYPLRTWYISQNVLLLLLLEMRARESTMVHYIDELIGSSNMEEDILGHVNEIFNPKEEKKDNPLVRFRDSCGRFKRRVTHYNSKTMKFVHLFIRPGPYESIFYERVSKMYSRAIGNNYGQMVGFIKDKMQVGR